MPREDNFNGRRSSVLEQFIERNCTDPLKAEAFRELVTVGQKSSINRELTPYELKGLYERYERHLTRSNTTRQDLMKQVYSYKLAEREKRLRSMERRGLRDDSRLTPLQKLEFGKQLAHEMRYAPKYKLSAPIEYLKTLDVRRHNSNKKMLKLNEVFAGEFARLYVDDKEADYIDLDQSEIGAIEAQQKQYELYNFKKQMHYTGRLGTKQKILRLAAVTLASATLVGGAAGITQGVSKVIENREQATYSTTLEAAQEAGYVTGHFLSTSRPDVEARDWESPEKKEAITILQEQGTAGLYDDINQKIELYKTNIPSEHDRQVFYEELRLLPDYILEEKTMPSYQSYKADDESYILKADSVKLTHIIDADINEYYLAFSNGSFTTDNFEARGLKDFYESRRELYEVVNNLQEKENSMQQGEISEYDFVQYFKGTLGQVDRNLSGVGKLATEEISYKDGFLLFPKKVKAEEQHFEVPNKENSNRTNDDGDER